MSDFTFNASAIGVGGVIDHAEGNRTVISSLASVALAPTGGEGSNLVENYSSNGVSFAQAESRVSGYETSRNTFTTRTDIYVSGLTVFKRFKVAMMQVTMTSTRYLPNEDDSTFQLSAMYRGVALDDEEILPSLDLDLCGAANYNELARTMLKNGQYAKRLGVTAKALRNAMVVRRAPVVGSIVSGLASRNALAHRPDHKLVVPKFGEVHFGEFLVKPGRRRVNLLRFEFDAELSDERLPISAPMGIAMAAPAGAETGAAMGPEDLKKVPLKFTGSLTVASVDGNGVPVWPH